MDGRAELQEVLDKARQGGARAAEVLRSSTGWLEQDGAKRAPRSGLEERWVVRVYREHGETGEGVAARADEALTAALRAAASATPDPHAGPRERMPVRSAGMGIDDRRHGQIGEEDRREILQLAERPFERFPVPLRDLLYREQRTRRSWMSSRGMEAEEHATTYALSAAVVTPELCAAHRIASRHFSDVASLPFGTELRRRVEPLLRPEPLPTSPLPLVLDPRVVADLARLVAPAFSARAVAAGGFLAGQLGKRLAAEVFHLTDDAGLFGGLASRAFDDRGVPPIAVTLLKEGVVTSLYHDPESARAEGLRPTGHVTEGGLRPSNLVVRPGARTRNVILTALGPHLVLDQLPPLDLGSGRLRGRVPVTRADRHERTGTAFVDLDVAVSELLHRIVEVAGDQERSGEVDAPSAVLEGVSLA